MNEDLNFSKNTQKAKEKLFDFSTEFGEIDVRLIEAARGPWTVNKYHVLQLYSRKLVSAAAILLLCIILAGNSTVQAAMEQFTTRIGEILGFTKNLSSYTEIIDQTQTKNDCSVTLNEIILDDHKLLLSLSVSSSSSEETPGIWIDTEKTTINGQLCQSFESMCAEKWNEDPDTARPDGILLGQSFDHLTLPEGEVPIHLVLNVDAAPSISAEHSELVTEFVYDFTIIPETLKAATVKQPLNISITGGDDGRIELKELTMNDLYCRIVASGITWDDTWANDYELKLKGKDSFGNPVVLNGGGFVSEKEMRFETSFFGDYEDSGPIRPEDFHMSVPDKDSTYLDLQLYARKIIWNPETEPVIPNAGDPDDGFYFQESAVASEWYAHKKNHGWEPVGKGFRIHLNSPAAENLYDTRCPYVGDAPAVGRILAQMAEAGYLPSRDFTFEIRSEAEPYGLMIHFNEELADRDMVIQQLTESGNILLALIDNLSKVEYSFTDSEDTSVVVYVYCDVKIADHNLKGSVKEYGTSPDKFSELLSV